MTGEIPRRFLAQLGLKPRTHLRPQEFPDLHMPEPAVEVLDAAEVPAFEAPFRDAAPAKDASKRNLTIGLIVGGSCLLLLCVCVAVAAVAYFIIEPVAR